MTPQFECQRHCTSVLGPKIFLLENILETNISEWVLVGHIITPFDS